MAGRFVALLRGINVGKAKRVAMADLRGWLADLGCTEIKTLLNSGNVVFSAQSTVAELEVAIAEAVATQGGVECSVVVLSEREVRAIAEQNPLVEEAEDPSRLLLSIVVEPKEIRLLRQLASKDWGAESFSVGSRASYVYSPDGVLKSEALKAVEKTLGGRVTSRNWKTFAKIVALL